MHDNGWRVLLQHCPERNLQVAQICVNRQWLFSWSVCCACPGQVILTFQDEGLDAGPRQIPALRCRRKSYGAHVQQLFGLLRYTAEGDHLVWNISDIHPSSSGGGHRGRSWCVCSTSWIIQSYLLLGFFCSRVFPSTRALVSRLDISGFKWELGFFKHSSIKESVLCW